MKKRRFLRQFGGIVSVGTASSLAGCTGGLGGFGDQKPNTITISWITDYAIEAFSMDVTTTFEDGESTNVSTMARSGKTQSFTLGDDENERVPQQATVVSQKQGGNTGELQLKIKSDNTTVASSVTTQPYGVVRVSHVFF